MHMYIWYALVSSHVHYILQGNAPFLISPLMGIQAISTAEVLYSPGCYGVWCVDMSGFDQAVTQSKMADVVVMVMGISTKIEG